MAPHVRRLTAGCSSLEIDQTVEILIEAFKLTERLKDYDSRLEDPDWRSTLLCALEPDAGEVWVAGLNAGDIDAVCISYGPDRWFLKGETERELRNQIYNSLRSEDNNPMWFDDNSTSRIKEIYELMFGETGEERERASWNIDKLAVRADKRGHRLGIALVQKIIEKGAEDGVEIMTVADSRKTIAFYERLGFEPIGDPHIADELGPDGKEIGLWPLMRQPKPYDT